MPEQPPSSPRATGIPEQVGAYRIIGHIGDGGMGTVHRGRHRSEEFASRQGGDVAVKVMHPHIARDESFAARFEREAGMGLKLEHPGLCRVHELIVDGGVLALVMELVEGEPLSQIIGTRTGPIPWERAWPMFQQLLDAVAYMHGEGVLHRDVKPENVLVASDGTLKLLDLGLAKDTGSGKTKTGVGMGTVDYMAPEQHTDASKVDERADIYALGMTLYEMLAGRLPWSDALDAVGVLHCKLSGDLPPPTDFYPDIAPELVEALRAALAADPAARTQSVTALRESLEQVSAEGLEGQTPGTSEAPPSPTGPSPASAVAKPADSPRVAVEVTGSVPPRSEQRGSGLGFELEGVCKTYELEGRRIEVLDSVDLRVEPGERVGVIGASGSGKSTLLALLGLLDRPTRGVVRYDGVDLLAAREDVIEEFRNQQVGFVFQFHHLLPEFTALENVMMPAIIAGQSMAEARERARELLGKVGLSLRVGHSPGELSGGEQQRVALARALVMQPRLVLADEPTGNLDPTTGDAIHDLLLELNQELGTTLIVATHNHALAARMPRRLEIRDGSIGSAEALQ